MRKPDKRTAPQAPKAISRQPLSRYEFYSVVVSSTALVVSLAAAVLQPILQYRVFNEYSERGILEPVSLQATAVDSSRKTSAEQVFSKLCPRCHSDQDGNYEDEFVLMNVGRRPLINIEIVVFGGEDRAKKQSILVDGRNITVDMQRTLQTFRISGVLAPGETIHIHAVINIASSILARTEHGDTTPLIDVSRHTNLTDDEIARFPREVDLAKRNPF